MRVRGGGAGVLLAHQPVRHELHERLVELTPTDPDDPMKRYRGVEAHAIDRDDAARLWNVSAEMAGINAFAGAA